MTGPGDRANAQAVDSSCLKNGRCFYEGSHQERWCLEETMCIRDREAQRGKPCVNKPNDTSHLDPPPPEAEVA